jgi:hypothetical protein
MEGKGPAVPVLNQAHHEDIWGGGGGTGVIPPFLTSSLDGNE